MCERHYYRCVDCLSIAAAEGPAVLKGLCGLCAGKIEHMGRVQGVRLVKDSWECPCDGRCTSARGPRCDCPCGGKNHGSNMVVRVVRDAGPVPRFDLAWDRVAAATAEEWRRGYSAVLNWIADYERRKRAGESLPYENYRHYLNLFHARGKLQAARDHKSRMKLIRKLLPEFEPVQAATAQACLFS